MREKFKNKTVRLVKMRTQRQSSLSPVKADIICMHTKKNVDKSDKSISSLTQ